MLSGSSYKATAFEDDALRANRNRVRRATAEASTPLKRDPNFRVSSKDGCGNMILWQSFERNKVNIFFNLCRNHFPILVKRCEFPLANLTFQLGPEPQSLLIAVGIGIDHFACGGHGKREVKLIETGAYALKRNGATMRFYLVSAGNIVVKRGKWLLI